MHVPGRAAAVAISVPLLGALLFTVGAKPQRSAPPVRQPPTADPPPAAPRAVPARPRSSRARGRDRGPPPGRGSGGSSRPVSLSAEAEKLVDEMLNERKAEAPPATGGRAPAAPAAVSAPAAASAPAVISSFPHDVEPGLREGVPPCGGIPCPAAGLRYALPAYDAPWPPPPEGNEQRIQRAENWRPSSGPWEPMWGTHNRGSDAVFALAKGYGLDTYQTFVGSLRRWGRFRGDIVVSIVADPTPPLRSFLEEHKATAYGPWECEPPSDPAAQRPLCAAHIDPTTYRHFMYREWLKRYSDQSLIFYLDFRDVFFQGDPFVDVPAAVRGTPKVWLFKEHWPIKKVTGCPINAHWIAQCWGSKLVRQLSAETIICSGGLMGTKPGMEIFEKRLMWEVARQDGTHQCQGGIVEQPLFNVLYHTGALDRAGLQTHAFPRGMGPFNSIGSFFPGSREGYAGPYEAVLAHMRDERGLVYDCPLRLVPDMLRCHTVTLGRWGSFDSHSCEKDKDARHFFAGCNTTRVSPIVHQWDRFQPDLIGFVRRYFTCAANCFEPPGPIGALPAGQLRRPPRSPRPRSPKRGGAPPRQRSAAL